MKWDDFTEEQKRNMYESYVEEVVGESGENNYMSYEEYCEDAKENWGA